MSTNPVVEMIEHIRKTVFKDFYEGKFNYDSAMPLLKRQIGVAEKMGEWLIVAKIYNTLAILEGELGNYERAIEYYEQSLATHTKIDNKLGYANALCGLGEVYRDMGQYDRAAECYLKSREIAEAEKDERLVVFNYANEGQLWLNVGSLERGIELMEIGIKRAESMETWVTDIRHRLVPEVCISLAKAHAQLTAYAKANEYLDRALQVAHEAHEFHLIGYAYQVIAEIAIQEGKPTTEIADYFAKSADYLGRINATVHLARLHVAEGDYWKAHGEPKRARQSYEKAESYFEKANLPQEIEALRQRMRTSSTSAR